MTEPHRLRFVRRALDMNRKRVKGPSLTHALALLRDSIDRAIAKDEERLRKIVNDESPKEKSIEALAKMLRILIRTDPAQYAVSFTLEHDGQTSNFIMNRTGEAPEKDD